MTIRAVAAVPSAPLLLPAVSPHQPVEVASAVAALRTDVAAVLDRLPTTPTVVLLAAGADTTVGDGGRVDLTGSGHPQVRVSVPVDVPLLRQVATGTGSPRLHADRLDGDLAVLAALVHTARPSAAIVPVTVAAQAGVATLSGFAARLVDALRDGPDVVVVAAGDLAATRDASSPRALVEGAVAFDDAALAAVTGSDHAALAALGPAEAARVVARGWASLVVLLAVAGDVGAPVAAATLHAPRGVGQLVATSVVGPSS